MALADTANLIVNLSLKGNFASQLSKSQRALGTFDARLAKSESRAFRVGQQIGTGIKNLARLGVAGATAVGSIAVASLKLAGDFEAQLNTINTIARETPAGLSKIGKQIRDIARATGTPLEELTQGYYDLLSAGIKAADAQGVLTAANRLAIGGLATTAETIDLLTSAINTYGLKASDAAKVSDIFAKAIERGKVTADELAASFAQVGPIAAASKISISELAAGYARLTASGVPAAEAATQIRSAIVALTRRTTDLKKLEKQTGRNYLSIAGKKGLVVALEQMRIDAKKAGVPLIDLLGRVEGLNFTLATTGANFDDYIADLKAMGDASGTAAAQMAERQKGLNFQLARLKALAKDAGITVGSKLLPKITPIFERINKAIAENEPAIDKFGDNLAGLFSDANIRTGVDALKSAFEVAREVAPVIADAARITGSALKVAVDAFKALPPDLQRLAIAGLAVNKLTGGLVTNVAGGLISAVLRQLVSGVVNVQGGVVNVAGIPGAGAAGAAAGGGRIKGILAGTVILGIGVAIGEAVVDYFGGKLTQQEQFGGGGRPVAQFGDVTIKLGASDAARFRDQFRAPPVDTRAHEGGGPRRTETAAAINKVTTAVEKLKGTAVPALGKITAGQKHDLAIIAANVTRTAGETKQAIAGSGAVTGALIGLGTATAQRQGLLTQGAVRASSAAVVSAIRANRPNISVRVAIQATQVTKAVTIQSRYGPAGGSSSQNSRYGSVPT